MMKNHDVALLVITVAVIAILFGMFVCGISVKVDYETEAINHGAAEYDSKTGEWRWIEKELKE